MKRLLFALSASVLLLGTVFALVAVGSAVAVITGVNVETGEGSVYKEGDWEYTVDSDAVTVVKYIGAGGDVTVPGTIDGLPVVAIGQWWEDDCGYRGAFENREDITGITIPNGVTSIGVSAFRYCRNLANIVIESDCATVAYTAFTDTQYYDRGSNWEDGVLYIGKYLIATKKTLTGAYRIKDGTVGLACESFAECSGLTGVVIPDGVAVIGDGAFVGCIGLTSITIPDSVTTVWPGTFYGCTSLTDIYCEATEKPAGWSNAWLNGCDAAVHWAKVSDCLPGDINGDGKVNSKDLTRLIKYLSGEAAEVEEATLDLNGDGKVNMKDYTRLLKYLSGEDVELH